MSFVSYPYQTMHFVCIYYLVVVVRDVLNRINPIKKIVNRTNSN